MTRPAPGTAIQCIYGVCDGGCKAGPAGGWCGYQGRPLSRSLPWAATTALISGNQVSMVAARVRSSGIWESVHQEATGVADAE